MMVGDNDLLLQTLSYYSFFPPTHDRIYFSRQNAPCKKVREANDFGDVKYKRISLGVVTILKSPRWRRRKQATCNFRNCALDIKDVLMWHNSKWGSVCQIARFEDRYLLNYQWQKTKRIHLHLLYFNNFDIILIHARMGTEIHAERHAGTVSDLGIHLISAAV